MKQNICTRCKKEDTDLRTLYHACLYQMEELGVPFDKVMIADRTFYAIIVCKICRAEWLAMIQYWFNNPPYPGQETATPTGVYIRKFGGTFEATPEEVEAIINEKEGI